MTQIELQVAEEISILKYLIDMQKQDIERMTDSGGEHEEILGAYETLEEYKADLAKWGQEAA